jgi:protein-disulfide isomerase
LAAGHVVCIYCVAVDACGLLAAGLVWQRLRHWSRRLLTPAGAGLAILLLGQAVVFRHPYQVQADVIGTATKPGAAADHHVRIVAGGRLFDLDPAKVPVIGSRSASHFIVVLSDYTCEHCRVTHRMLEQSERVLGDRVGVIVLPVLLDPAANPYLPPGVTHPLPQDTALTRIALAVYCARPAAFAEMNRWLFAEDRVREEAEARAYAGKLVGVDALRSAEGDPRISQMILTGCELFARSGSGEIPKMLIGSTQISGAIEDQQALRKVVGREWGVELPNQ